VDDARPDELGKENSHDGGDHDRDNDLQQREPALPAPGPGLAEMVCLSFHVACTSRAIRG
jgi:hypothetical protein